MLLSSVAFARRVLLISLENLLGGCQHSVSVPSVGISESNHRHYKNCLSGITWWSRWTTTERTFWWPTWRSWNDAAPRHRPPPQNPPDENKYQNILLHHVWEAEPVFLKTFMEPRNRFRQPGWNEKQGCRTGPPGWESISGLFKMSTNTGSVLMQAYFFVMPHTLIFVFYRAFFILIFGRTSWTKRHFPVRTGYYTMWMCVCVLNHHYINSILSVDS